MSAQREADRREGSAQLDLGAVSLSSRCSYDSPIAESS